MRQINYKTSKKIKILKGEKAKTLIFLELHENVFMLGLVVGVAGKHFIQC